jgi:hypothetical protein
MLCACFSKAGKGGTDWGDEDGFPDTQPVMLMLMISNHSFQRQQRAVIAAPSSGSLIDFSSYSVIAFAATCFWMTLILA